MEDSVDQLLNSLGLRYEDLTIAEKETYNSWLRAAENQEITLGDVRTYVSTMKDSVINDLTRTGISSDEDKFMKARLRNYTLLLAFLESPIRAKEALKKAMEGVSRTR